MKITNFQLTIQQGVDKQGYADNFYINIDDKGLANISRPYKSIPVEEHLAIEEIITSAIKAHLKLVKQVDNANKDLKLEEYRPITSETETISEIASESTDVSTLPQSCALGDGEVSTGAKRVAKTLAEQIENVDNDREAMVRFAKELSKPKSEIVITRVTEEDNW